MGEETERVAVRTYVPSYQRDRWREEADDLDMSQSEFVRTMVQAGRRDFDLEDESKNTEDTPDPTVNPWGEPLERRIIALLRSEGHLNWEELVTRITDGIEQQIEDALDELQDENRVRYRPRIDGYVLVGDDE